MSDLASDIELSHARTTSLSAVELNALKKVPKLSKKSSGQPKKHHYNQGKKQQTLKTLLDQQTKSTRRLKSIVFGS